MLIRRRPRPECRLRWSSLSSTTSTNNAPERSLGAPNMDDRTSRWNRWLPSSPPPAQARAASALPPNTAAANMPMSSCTAPFPVCTGASGPKTSSVQPGSSAPARMATGQRCGLRSRRRGSFTCTASAGLHAGCSTSTQSDAAQARRLCTLRDASCSAICPCNSDAGRGPGASSGRLLVGASEQVVVVAGGREEQGRNSELVEPNDAPRAVPQDKGVRVAARRAQRGSEGARGVHCGSLGGLGSTRLQLWPT
ncbi:unnamed protein product, partial [Prorocentrum cordatum]